MAREPPQLRRVGLRNGWAVDSNGGALRPEPPAGGREEGGESRGGCVCSGIPGTWEQNQPVG